MITHIHSASVIVSDLEAALDFYINVLGWEKRIDQMMGEEYRFVTVGPVGGQAELSLGPAKFLTNGEVRHLIPDAGGMGPQTGITFAVEDVEATYQALVDKGVKFIGPLQDMPWGDRATWLLDPDGNSFFFTGR